VDILSYLQTQNNFQEILSTTNDYSQTLAHLSIFFGYPSLLRHLIEWGTDLAISDINGLTAFHCAFMKGDLDSVRILRQGGASETVTDKLGRTPSDLQPEGFSLTIDLDAEVAAELDTEMRSEESDIGNIDEQMALEELFDNLDSGDENEPGYSQPGAAAQGGAGTSFVDPDPERYNNRIFREGRYRTYPRTPGEDLLNPKLSEHEKRFYEARRASPSHSRLSLVPPDSPGRETDYAHHPRTTSYGSQFLEVPRPIHHTIVTNPTITEPTPPQPSSGLLLENVSPPQIRIT